MKKRVGASLYFASDKVIFDALNHRQVKTDLVRDLLYERGIVASAKTPKDDLAHYFSRIPADFFDHKSIGEKLGRISKRERITFAEIDDPITSDQIRGALSHIKAELEVRGNPVRIDFKDNRFSVNISYEHIDYTEVEFRQVQPRDAVIEFVSTGDGDKFFVRSTQNSFTDVVVEEIFAALGNLAGKKIEKSEISLEGHADHKLRTKFFETLMHGIDGHEFVTVTEAYCYKPRTSEIGNDSDDSETELEDQPYVERVGLKGKGVNRSFVIDDLYEKGYYIVKVVWHVKPKKSLDSDVFELEAQFSSPATCTEFSYQTKGVLIFEDGQITDKKRAPKFEEEDVLFRLIESAAKSALESLEG